MNFKRVILNTTTYISIIAFFLGMLFKLMSWPGAGLMIIISSFILILISIRYTLGIQKRQYIFIPISFILVLLGVTLKLNSIKGGSILLLISLILLIVSWLYGFVKTFIILKPNHPHAAKRVLLLGLIPVVTFSYSFVIDYILSIYLSIFFVNIYFEIISVYLILLIGFLSMQVIYYNKTVTKHLTVEHTFVNICLVIMFLRLIVNFSTFIETINLVIN